MIWHIAGHEIALTGAGQSYEDSFEPWLMLVCITCWEHESGVKNFLLWKDHDELNPEQDQVDIDYGAALRSIAAHLAPDAVFEDAVVDAGISLAALAGNLDAGVRVLREQPYADR